MKITSIRQQAKNPERASIFVDGKYSFSLSLNELVAERLRINQEIDDAELKRLKKLSDEGKLKARTLEWVLNRPRSVRELRDYLYRKKTEPEQITNLTEELEKRGYISDEAFTLWLVDMRKRGGKSNRAIENELFKKGVARDIVSKSMPKDQAEEEDRLRAVYTKKSRLSRYKADPNKLIQYLLRQGFGYSDVKKIMSGD